METWISLDKEQEKQMYLRDAENSIDSTKDEVLKTVEEGYDEAYNRGYDEGQKDGKEEGIREAEEQFHRKEKVKFT